MRNLLFALLLALPGWATATYNFSWDTSILPPTNVNYILDLVLIGDAGNQLTLSGFSFGGGSGPNLSVTLDSNASFFSESMVTFTPGTQLSFTVTTTTNLPVLPSTLPDTFSVYLLDTSQSPIPTADSFASAILTFDVGPAPAAIVTYGGVSPLAFAAPVFQLVPSGGGGNEVPEPSSLGLMGGAVTLWCLRRNQAKGKGGRALRLALNHLLLLVALMGISMSSARASVLHRAVLPTDQLMDGSYLTPGTTYYVMFNILGVGGDAVELIVSDISINGGTGLGRSTALDTDGFYVVGPDDNDPQGIWQSSGTLTLRVAPMNSHSAWSQAFIANDRISFDYDFQVTPGQNSSGESRFVFQLLSADFGTVLYSSVDDANGPVSPVPEPGVLAMVVGGGMLLGLRGWRRRK